MYMLSKRSQREKQNPKIPCKPPSPSSTNAPLITESSVRCLSDLLLINPHLLPLHILNHPLLVPV